jgi:MraZ protein
VSESRLPPDFKPLIGTEEANLDDKGRLLVSKKKRERLGDDFILVLGKVGCLIAYPKVVWEQLLSEIFAVETMNPAREEYTRLVLGTAEDDLKFDVQGRVVVPQKLRTEAKLSREILLIGCGDRVEIWAKAEWEKFNEFPEQYGKDRRFAIEAAYNRMVGRPVE